MKQHITPKQMQEITKEQFYGLFNGEGIVKRKDWASFHCKKMNIGKLFELLKDKGCTYINPLFYPAIGWFWTIDVTFKDGTENPQDQSKHDELCDGLWTILKQII